MQVQSSARGRVDGRGRASPAGPDHCTASRHPASPAPLLPLRTFRLPRTAPRAPHPGCDRSAEPGCASSRNHRGRLGPGTRGAPLPTAGRKGSEEAAGAPRAGRVPIRSDLRAPQPPTATTTEAPARGPPRTPPDPGPRLTCLLLWLPPSQLPLRLPLRPRRSRAHPAGETGVAPAPPRRWGKSRPRGRNRRKWSWEG